MLGSRHCRLTLLSLAALFLLVSASGCGSLLGGRPKTYTDLAASVVDAFADNDYNALRELVVTNDEMRGMGLQAEGDEGGHFAPAENAILESWDKVRNQGTEAGLFWKDAELGSAIPLNARNKVKEKVDVKVVISCRHTNYEILIKNAQYAYEGVVLTDKIEWVGAR